MYKQLNIIIISMFSSFACASSWWDAPELYHGNAQIATEKLLIELQRGKKILFLDTREFQEYQQSHIPSAKHLMLRDVDKAPLQEMAKYDYIVPYCLKDFRGFEVARRLMKRGLNNVVMMEPSGLRGWQSLNLPLATPSLNDKTALQKLSSSLPLKSK